MKRKNYIVILLAIISFIFSVNVVKATVGGPTFVSTFKYNPLNESVYFIITDNGGRGCPPELAKISLSTGKTEIVYSCEQGEELLKKNNYNISLVNSEINKIIKDYKPLSQISLKDNKIFVDVNFLNSEKYPPEIGDEIMKSTFTASVYQDNVKVIDLPIVGCNKEQPFLFAGYSIPGFEKKIILLLSTKGDCFEGGYIRETLNVVGGISNLDKTFSSNSIKEASALISDNNTLIVYEADKIDISTKETSESSSINEIQKTNNDIEKIDDSDKYNFSIFYVFIIAILSILFGIFLGKLFYKKN